MATVKRNVDPADLAVSIRTEPDGMRVSVVCRADGFVVAHKQPIASADFALELARVLALLGVEPEHALAPPRDELERARANAVRELAELKQLFHKEQTLSGELAEKVAELEGERASLSSRLAGVERERSELGARVAAYDNAARQMSKMSAAGDPPSERVPNEERKTNPGGRPAP